MVNELGEIKAVFETDGVRYELISTNYGKKGGVWDSQDKIRNSHGATRTLTRKEWREYFNKKVSK